MTDVVQGLLPGRRILVTGAARGIGLAVAKALQAHGARVAMADIDAALCAKEAKAIPGALPLALDVTHASSIAAAAASLQQHFGGLDGLVNNAALLNESHAASVTADEMNRIMAANGTSILHVSQAMLPMLEKSPGAAIVNTLSTQSFFAQPHGTAYGAAKGAAVALTRCMAVDFAPLGIRVNGVAPGFINTRMAIMPDGKHEHETPLFRSFYAEARKIPLGRAGTAEECAGAFVFLLSPLSDYITGQVVTVDGGLTATY